MATTAIAIGTMNVAQVSNPGADFQIFEREIPEPGLGQARIRVQAHFGELTGVRPMIETYPLEKADEAYARMMSGKAQFRVVLTM